MSIPNAGLGSLEHVYAGASHVQNYDGASAYGAVWHWAGAANAHGSPLRSPNPDTASQKGYNTAVSMGNAANPQRRTWQNPTTEGDKRLLFGQGRPMAKDSSGAGVNWYVGTLSQPQSVSQGNVNSRLFFEGTVTATDMSRATDAREKGRIGIFGTAESYGGSYPRVTSASIGRDLNPLGRGGGQALVGGMLNVGKFTPRLPRAILRGGKSGNSVNNPCGGGGCGGGGGIGADVVLPQDKAPEQPPAEPDFPVITPTSRGTNKECRSKICSANYAGGGNVLCQRSIGNPRKDPVCCDECTWCYLGGTHLHCYIAGPGKHVKPAPSPLSMWPGSIGIGFSTATLGYLPTFAPTSYEYMAFAGPWVPSNGQPMGGNFKTSGNKCCRVTSHPKGIEGTMNAGRNLDQLDNSASLALDCIDYYRDSVADLGQPVTWSGAWRGTWGSVLDCLKQKILGAIQQYDGCCPWTLGDLIQPACCDDDQTVGAITCSNGIIILCPAFFEDPAGGVNQWFFYRGFGLLGEDALECDQAHILIHEAVHACMHTKDAPFGNYNFQDDLAYEILSWCGCGGSGMGRGGQGGPTM